MYYHLGICARVISNLESKQAGKQRVYFYLYESFSFPPFHQFWLYLNLIRVCNLFLITEPLVQCIRPMSLLCNILVCFLRRIYTFNKLSSPKTSPCLLWRLG